MHVHLWPVFSLKFFVLPFSVPWTVSTAKSDGKGWQRNKEWRVTCNRGPQRTQTGDIVVTWCASYRLLLLQDISSDWPVFYRFRQLIHIPWQRQWDLNPADKSGTILYVFKVIKREQSTPWRSSSAVLFLDSSHTCCFPTNVNISHRKSPLVPVLTSTSAQTQYLCTHSLTYSVLSLSANKTHCVQIPSLFASYIVVKYKIK